MAELIVVALVAFAGLVAVLVAVPLEDQCYCGAEDCDCVGFEEET